MVEAMWLCIDPRQDGVACPKASPKGREADRSIVDGAKLLPGAALLESRTEPVFSAFVRDFEEVEIAGVAIPCFAALSGFQRLHMDQ